MPRWPLTVTFPWDPCAVPNNARLAWTGSRFRSTDRWAAASARAAQEAMVQSVGIRPDGEVRFSAELAVHYPMEAGHPHAGDVDAYVKIVLDALEEYVYEDDQQVDHLVVDRVWESEDPRLVLTVEPITPKGGHDADAT